MRHNKINRSTDVAQDEQNSIEHQLNVKMIALKDTIIIDKISR